MDVFVEAESLDPGTLVWVEDSDQVWELAQVLSQEHKTVLVRCVGSGTWDQPLGEEREVNVGFEEIHRAETRAENSAVPDLTALNYLVSE